MRTERLAEELAAGLAPVRRLRPPGTRLLLWLAVALPAAVAVVLAFGPRPDLARVLARPGFAIELAAALLTAFAAAYAALCAGLPDRPGWLLLLPLPPLALWLATLGRQCLEVWLRLGPEGLRVTSDAMCLPAIALGGIAPALAMVAMLRRGGRFRATPACLCGGLAAASFGAAALRFYHTEDAALMVLVWQMGSVALLTLLATAIGPAMLARRA